MSVLTRVPRATYDRNCQIFDEFVPDADYRIGTARGMAWLAQLAYETEDAGKIAEILQQWGLALIGEVLVCSNRKDLPTAMTQGFVAQGRGATIVAFSGTDPVLLANWATNFDIALAADGCARGFHDAAVIARTDVLDRLTLTDASNRLFVTGHSLGGALAVVTALSLAAQGRAVHAVYTFGMPRPGNAAFATTYNQALGSCTYRLVYGDDLVPTVAPSALGFRHVGRHLHSERFGSFRHVVPDPQFGSDAPLFTDGVRKDWNHALFGLAHPVTALTQQIAPAIRILFGDAAESGRTDTVAALIELLPPRLRDHIPDRYCFALA